MHKLKKLRLSKDLPGVNLYRRDKFSFVFRRPGLTAHRVNTDPAFAATRRRATAFARAAGLAAHLHRLLAPLLGPVAAKTNYRRLVAALVKDINNRQSWPGRGVVNILKAFPCNSRSIPQPGLLSRYRLAYDSPNNTITLSMPSLRLTRDINPPIGATHAQPWMMLAIIQGQTGLACVKLHQENAFFPLFPGRTRKMKLSMQNVSPPAPVVLAVAGIRFWVSSPGEWAPFNHQASDAADIFVCRVPLAVQLPFFVRIK